jgi:hypothetical protein
LREFGHLALRRIEQMQNLLAYAFSGSNPLLPSAFIRANLQVFKPFCGA